MAFDELQIDAINFPNLGYLQLQLNNNCLTYLWDLIENHKESFNHRLIGHISNSYSLEDKDNWFFNNVLIKLCSAYATHFANIGNSFPTKLKHPYYLESFWVNFQKEHEFNPVHDHFGIYSFVIWMKIPTDFVEQNNNPIAKNSNAKKISSFDLYYTNTLGNIVNTQYDLDSSYEGTMLFFPAKLNHAVYPFYNCKETRISISGNIALNSQYVIID